MSLRIRVSYERNEEIDEVLRLLAPLRLTAKMPQKMDGAYRRAYLESPKPTPIHRQRTRRYDIESEYPIL